MLDYNIGTKVFNDWEIVGELGEGSYGKVFELSKTSFNVTSKSALKLIRVPRSPSEIREALIDGMDEKSATTYFEEIVEQFVREIAVMSDLKSNNNIVSVEDYVVEPHAGTIGWDILIRMELLTSLNDYQLNHKMDEPTVIRLAEDILNALIFCQKKGLIHRDIKPGNVFVNEQGSFKLGDFGVARTAEKTLSGLSKQGTENYMAPEVYYSKPYGVSVDIYSLGLMLYRLLNGNRLPFYPLPPEPIRLSDRESALKKRMEGTPLPLPCDASEDFSAIILKACAHDPQKRYRTAAEMLEAIKQMQGSTKENSDSFSKLDSADDRSDSAPTFSGPDVDDLTFSPFSSKEPIQEEKDNDFSSFDDDKTVSPFSRSGSKSSSDDTPLSDEDRKKLDKHMNVHLSADTCPRGEMLKVKTLDGKEIEILVPQDVKNGQSIEVAFMGNVDEKNGCVGSLWITFLISAKKKNVDDFWRTHLGECLNERHGSWGAYFPPDISPQMYANAIHNITANRVKKDEILGILDYTSDFSIPCGAGIVITEDKMYIQLGSDTWGKAGFLNGGIPSKEITFNDLLSVSCTPKTFFKFPTITWNESKNPSVSTTYKVNREGNAFNFDALVKNLLKCKEILKGE